MELAIIILFKKFTKEIWYQILSIFTSQNYLITQRDYQGIYDAFQSI